MPTLTKQQIQRVYALGAKAQLLDSGNKNDDLHAFVYQLTGQTSISNVDQKHFNALEKLLLGNVRAVNPPPEPVYTKKQEPQAWASKEQAGLAFRLIYRLQELSPSSAAPKSRLAGVMEKVLGRKFDVDKDIFYGVSSDEANKVIETLKRYVRNEERKQKRRAENEPKT